MAPLRRDMPTRDPERAATDTRHVREYSAETGGWTEPATGTKAPATTAGGEQR